MHLCVIVFKVIKLTSKYKFPLFVLVVSLALIVISLFFNFEKKREKDALYQRILLEQQAQKEKLETEEKNYLMGKFEPAQQENFVAVPEKYNIGGYTMYLRKETLDAYLKMQEMAAKEGIDLKIVSATRNFDYQKGIWNNKWSGITLVDGKKLNESLPDKLERFKKILEYSSVPGTSRHHWGTEVDLNSTNFEYFETEKGQRAFTWLVKNASSYGFCQPYNLKGSTRPTGYNEERWHWSYLPLAKTFLKDYARIVKEKDINNFLGDQYVSQLDLINNYILSINSICL